ncbi:hypothetical protein QAD02_018308 [Eretmocerus hayati]|uniref:Uncharacterized protein n=1 Tax=Eretmocerus hayati TaxID=131215 RepID=A0ACC2PHK2_9HYME|nr:hypothetical protein QAD02_018308 [Eretmocerus hayati]
MLLTFLQSFPPRPSNFAVVRIPQKCAGFAVDTFFAVANNHVGKFQNGDFVRMEQGPYNEEDPEKIRQILRNGAVPPPTDWPFVVCDVLWYTDTLDAADSMINLCQNESVSQSRCSTASVSPKKMLSQKLDSVPRILPKSTKANSLAVDIPKSDFEEPFVEQIPISTDTVAAHVTDFNGEVLGGTSPNSVHAEPSSHLDVVTQVDIASSIENSGDLAPSPSMIKQHPSADTAYDEILGMLAKLCKKIDDFQKYFKQRFASIEAKINNMEKDLNQLSVYVKENRLLKRNEEIMTESEFAQKHNLKFPLESIDDFKAFEAKIGPEMLVQEVISPEETVQKVINSQVFEDLKTHLISNTDSSLDVKISCDRLFKAMFSGDIMRAITSQRASRTDATKIVLKTRFFTCMRDAFTHVYANKVVVNGDGTKKTVVIGDGKIILDHIGTIINKGHEWGNPRSKAKSRKSDGNPDEVSRENSVDGNKRKSSDTVNQVPKRRSNTETSHDQNEVLCEKSTNVMSSLQKYEELTSMKSQLEKELDDVKAKRKNITDERMEEIKKYSYEKAKLQNERENLRKDLQVSLVSENRIVCFPLA